MTVYYASILIFFLALLMSMTGRGGGNFYVPILIAFGLSAYDAAAAAQLILVFSAVAAMLVFHKSRMVDWKLALILDPPTDIMAFVGGYFAHSLPETLIKGIFAVLLVIAALFMLRKTPETTAVIKKRAGYWYREYGDVRYSVNMWLAMPVTIATGFVAGMVGISGGSFKVPLMVLACGVPMRIAVGTSSAMVAATALMGFLGHSASGLIDLHGAFLLAIAGVAGGLAGGKYALKTNPAKLKRIFAVTTLAAAVFMCINILLTG